MWEETALEEMAKVAGLKKQLTIERGEVTGAETLLITGLCWGLAKSSYSYNTKRFFWQ